MGDNLPEYRFCGFIVDTRTRVLTGPDGKPVHLSSRAFATLQVLLEHQGRTLSKAELMASVWPAAVVEDNNLNQAIYALRRALGDSKAESRFIKTIAGRGYCFVAPVEVLVPDSANGIDHPALARRARLGLSGRKTLYVAGLALVIAAFGGFLLLRAQSSLPVPQAGTLIAGDPAPSASAADYSENETIAVLPFAVQDLSAEQKLFTVGLHDEVISQLSKIRSLSVIARNSIMSLVQQEFTTAEMADLLNVGSFVSGTIMYSGDHARIIVDMHDADSGITRWSGAYEVSKGDLAEMFSTQSRIAIDLAQALEAEILHREQESITAIPTNSVDAYRNYLSARVARYNQDFESEWRLAQRAIALDPEFYDAHAVFSSVNTVLVADPLPDMDSRQHFLMGLESAEKLIALDPENSKGHALKAIALSTSGDWDGVFKILDDLTQMQAPLASLNYIAIVLLCVGDFDRAIEIYRENLRTEPLNLYGRGFLMAALELAGRREDSRAQYLAGERLSPVWWGDIVNVFLALGRNESIPDIDQLSGLSEEYKAVLKKVNNDEDIRPDLYRYRKSDRKVSADALHYAALAAHTGEHVLALEFLQAGLKDNRSGILWVWLPVFDEIRQLDGFKTLLVDAGLVDHWRKNGWTDVCRPDGDSFRCDWTAY